MFGINKNKLSTLEEMLMKIYPKRINQPFISPSPIAYTKA